MFKYLKHCEFFATFVLFCAVYAELCAMLLVADSADSVVFVFIGSFCS